MQAKLLISCVALILALPAGRLAAQQDADDAAYRRGVGAYFAGRTDRAEELLTQAIDERPDDPRPYYFRGLNRLRDGDRSGAEADLTEGARLEATQGDVSAEVHRSLSAVQGPARLTLERIRRESRQEAELKVRRQRQQARKQARAEQEATVLRTPYELPLEALASRLTVEQARNVARASAADRDASDPFADDSSAAVAADTTTNDSESPSGDDVPSGDESPSVDVPPEARGTVSRSTLFRIFGRAADQGTQGFTSFLGRTMGPTMDNQSPFGPGGGPPGDFGQQGFEQQGFGEAEFGPGDAGENPFGEAGETPFGEDGENPFGNAEEPPSGEAEENPFGTGEAPEGNPFEMDQQPQDNTSQNGENAGNPFAE